MDLRTKTLSVLVIALLAITGVTYVVAGQIVSGGFGSIERAEAAQNLDRVEQALTVELNRMNSTVGDWSVWDETYAFVQDGNQDYVDANLFESTLTNLRVDSMMFYDAEGQLVEVIALSEDGTFGTPSDETIAAVSNAAPLFTNETTEATTTGIVRAPAGAMLVAARPITTSEGEGPIMGTLVMTRWVNDGLVAELRDVTKLNISLAQPAGAVAPGERKIETAGSGTLLATTVLPAVDGSPALELQLDMPRTTFAEGKDTLNYLVLALLAIGVAFGALIIVVLEATVLRPVHRLSSFVRSVGTDFHARTKEAGRDEIGELSRALNGMLGTIETYSSAVTAANAELEQERARVVELNQSLEQKVADRTAELEMANSELTDRNRQLIVAIKQATTDGLTGLKNHRTFQEDVRRAAENPKPDKDLAVFMADLDRFKEVNDAQGHQAGDAILERVAELFRAALDTESVYRYGGDEFAMMVWVESIGEAEWLAEDIRKQVAGEFRDIDVTVSIGIAVYSSASSAEELIYHADAAMYGAKAARKNRVRIWTPTGIAMPADTAVS